MSEIFATDDELQELLVNRLDVLSLEAFEETRAMAKRLRVPLGRALSERARVPMSFIVPQLADLWGIGYTELRVEDIRPEAIALIPENFAKTKLVVAFEKGATLKVAAAKPRDPRLMIELRQVTSTPNIELVLAPTRAIQRAHMLYDPWLRDAMKRNAAGAAIPVAKPGEPDPSATQLATRILEYAVIAGASDIHIEPYEFEGLVRYRVDGALNEVFSLPPEAYPSLVARFKVQASMRVDEKRAPQDGRFGVTLGGTGVDFRVSSVPTHYGEKIVMRLLSTEPAAIDIERLGLAADDYQILLKSILRPFGMILVTGPTGTGKTTTLYATLARITAERSTRLNISTIEDPVEQQLPRVSQIAVNPTAGIDFAGGLRALLRQDPDVIMVGEIRDRETAEISVRAALVGRLLLSTLHTNDAAGAIPRLVDMGIERFLLASTLELVLAQRLARRICVGCRESVDPDSPSFKTLHRMPAFTPALTALQKRGVLSSSGDLLAQVRLFRGRGCPQCNGSGYRGRIGLFELLHINEDIRQLMLDPAASAVAIRALAIEGGMKTMFEDGLAKVFLGETTIEEVRNATA